MPSVEDSKPFSIFEHFNNEDTQKAIEEAYTSLMGAVNEYNNGHDSMLISDVRFFVESKGGEYGCNGSFHAV